MCFSLFSIEHLLIWIVILAAIIGVLKILIPWVCSAMGISVGPLPQIINIIVMAIVVIAVIVVVFTLLSCLGGVHFP